MIEGSSAYLPNSAPTDGAIRDAAVLLSPEHDAKSAPKAQVAGRLAPKDIVQLSAAATGKTGAEATGLTEDQKAEVAGLKRQDAETRRHEQAHANAGGPYSGTPSYSYERGPDGRSYAVAGTTPIDVSPVSGNPAATVRKMETVKRAALAPGEPSAQDRKVAAQADAEKRKAQAERTAENISEPTGETDPRHNGAEVPVATAYGGGGAGQQPNVSPLFDLIA